MEYCGLNGKCSPCIPGSGHLTDLQMMVLFQGACGAFQKWDLTDRGIRSEEGLRVQGRMSIRLELCT